MACKSIDLENLLEMAVHSLFFSQLNQSHDVFIEIKKILGFKSAVMPETQNWKLSVVGIIHG